MGKKSIEELVAFGYIDLEEAVEDISYTTVKSKQEIYHYLINAIPTTSRVIKDLPNYGKKVFLPKDLVDLFQETFMDVLDQIETEDQGVSIIEDISPTIEILSVAKNNQTSNNMYDLLNQGYFSTTMLMEELSTLYGYSQKSLEHHIYKTLPEDMKIIIKLGKTNKRILVSPEGRLFLIDKLMKTRPKKINIQHPAGSAEIIGGEQEISPDIIDEKEYNTGLLKDMSVEQILQILPEILGMPQAETIKVIMKYGDNKTIYARIIERRD